MPTPGCGAPAPASGVSEKQAMAKVYLELRYSLSHLGKSMIWQALEVYALFYLTEIAGMAPGTAGLAFSVILSFDALANLAVGISFDRLTYAHFPARIVVWITPPMIVVFVFGFVQQPFVPAGAWAIAMMLLARIGFVLVDIPHNAVMLRMADQDHSGTRLATMRHLAGLCAILFVAAFSWALTGATMDANGIERLIAAIGICGGALLMLTPGTRWEAKQPPVGATPEPGAGRLSDVVANPVVLGVLALALAGYVANSLMAHSLPYAAKLAAGDPRSTGEILLALTLAKVISVPLIWFGIHRAGELRAGATVMGLFGLAGLALATQTLPGLQSAPILLAMGLADTGMTIVSWALLMKAYAHGRRQGNDRAGTVSTLFTSMGRLGSGLSGLILSGMVAQPGPLFVPSLGVAMGLCSLVALAIMARLGRIIAITG